MSAKEEQSRSQAEAMIDRVMHSHEFSRNEAVTAIVMMDNRERYFERSPLTDGTPLGEIYASEMNNPLNAHLTTDEAAKVIAYVYGCTVEEAAAYFAQQVDTGAIPLETMQ